MSENLALANGMVIACQGLKKTFSQGALHGNQVKSVKLAAWIIFNKEVEVAV